MGTYIKTIVLVVVLLFLITFGVKNSQFIELDYYFDFLRFSIPVYALAYACIVIGIFVGMIMGWGRRYSLRRQRKSLEQENRELRQKLDSVDYAGSDQAASGQGEPGIDEGR